MHKAVDDVMIIGIMFWGRKQNSSLLDEILDPSLLQEAMARCSNQNEYYTCRSNKASTLFTIMQNVEHRTNNNVNFM